MASGASWPASMHLNSLEWAGFFVALLLFVSGVTVGLYCCFCRRETAQVWMSESGGGLQDLLFASEDTDFVDHSEEGLARSGTFAHGQRRWQQLPMGSEGLHKQPLQQQQEEQFQQRGTSLPSYPSKDSFDHAAGTRWSGDSPPRAVWPPAGAVQPSRAEQ